MLPKKKVADGVTGDASSTEKARPEPETEGSTVINAVGVEGNVYVFADTSTYDTQQAICTIPAGTIIEIYGHSCKGDGGEIKKLWINFNIDTEPASAGSASNPCEKYGGNNQLNSYWVPMFDIWECDKWSLQELLEMYDGLAGYAYSGGEPSETGNPGGRVSFEDGEGSNFVYKLICKLARKLLNDPDSFSYYSEQSQFDIKGWECADAVVCQGLAICGGGFFVCPLKGFDWIYPDGQSYGTQKMDKLIYMCELKPHTMVLCRDATIPCSSKAGCENIFKNPTCNDEDLYPHGYCENQEADFYFKCSDVTGS